MTKKVFVGMSGGVDSSVAAMLLKDQGYGVVGVFMRCYNIDGCAERDAEDARRAAEQIGIPFYVWDFEEEYKKRVMEYMIDGYRNGITPNPDVMCNKEIKFGLFLKKALAMGADYVATGHYVRIVRDGADRSQLFMAKDKTKDQSYFLWTLTQVELVHCLFPIGDFLKTEIRAQARQAGLPTAEKKDSQGICFLGEVSVTDFLKQYIPEKHGVLVTTTGVPVGEHSGSEFYTIGQRHIAADFRFPKTGRAAERMPLYVAEKDAATNTVVLAEGSDHPALYKKEIKLANVNFLSGSPPDAQEMPVFARVRYRQPLSRATLACFGADHYKLTFEKPQKFVASGQSAVWYSTDGEMLGGGVVLQARETAIQ